MRSARRSSEVSKVTEEVSLDGAAPAPALLWGSTRGPLSRPAWPPAISALWSLQGPVLCSLFWGPAREGLGGQGPSWAWRGGWSGESLERGQDQAGVTSREEGERRGAVGRGAS